MINAISVNNIATPTTIRKSFKRGSYGFMLVVVPKKCLFTSKLFNRPEACAA